MKFVQLCKIKTEESFLFFTVKTCKGVVFKGHRRKSIGSWDIEKKERKKKPNIKELEK